jgi:hypothetical protein
MAQRARRLCFAQEALPELRLVRDGLPQKLHRDGAASDDVGGGPNGSHPPFSQVPDQAVAARN